MGFAEFLEVFRTNEEIQSDFFAFSKAIDDLIEREGLSESEATQKVSEVWFAGDKGKELKLKLSKGLEEIYAEM